MFTSTLGSIPGREHLRLQRNCQDAAQLQRAGAHLLGVVTDGCSMGTHSEVGAKLAAAWLARWTLPALAEATDPLSIQCGIDRLADDLLAYLGGLLRGLDPEFDDPQRAAGLVADHLLFTLLVAVLGPERWFVFGLGDGCWAVDGCPRALDPGPSNTPDYLAYRLVDPGQLERPARRPLTPVLHQLGATADLTTLLIGTDGVLPILRRPELLEPLLADPACGSNPFLLQRRLRSIAEQERLHDDATLVLFRRQSQLEERR